MAAEALPVTKRVNFTRWFGKSSLFYQYQPSNANLESRMSLFLTKEEISDESFVLSGMQLYLVILEFFPFE